jgi:hypothetical protein
MSRSLVLDKGFNVTGDELVDGQPLAVGLAIQERLEAKLRASARIGASKNALRISTVANLRSKPPVHNSDSAAPHRPNSDPPWPW